MRRLLLLVLLLVLAPAAPAAADWRAAVDVDRCAASRVADERVAVFVARMRAVRGAERMQLRFALQERGRDGRWRSAGALGGWNTSDPDVGGYVFTKRVERLAAPAGYRVLVRYRWLDEAGEIIASARRTSRACEQPDLRPNLRPVLIEMAPELDGSTRYRVRVRNTGPTSSGPFDVSVTVGGTPLPVVTSPGAPAGRIVFVELRGPACPAGGTVEAVADASATLPERREDDNALWTLCPTP